MNSHSSSVSSNQEETTHQNKFDISHHNIIFSDTLSRRSKSSTSSSASKLATLSDKINSSLTTGAETELAAFKRSHAELQELANYCQKGEIGFNEIKTFSAQSLASVAYRINSASKLVLEVLSTQANQFSELDHELNLTNQRVQQLQERRGRHKIAEYTTDKNTVYMRRITPPSIKERPQAYIRAPIDYSKYDGVGRGFFYGDCTHEVPRYARQTVPLSLSSASGDFQIIPRIANDNTSDSPTLPPVYNHKLTNGSADTYSVPITTFHPDRYITRSKHLKPREHAIPIFYPSHNTSNSTLNRYSPDTLGQGHTTDSLYDYIQPVPRHTPNNWERSSESTSVTSAGKDSLRPDEYSLPDLSQFPAPPEYLLTSSPLDDTNTQTYEMMISQQQQQQQQQEERESPTLLQVNKNTLTPPVSYIEKVLTVYKYVSQRYDELSFEPGNIIYVIKKNEDGWYEGFLNGYRGLFPGNYAEQV